MDNKKIKFGVVGVGYLGKHHVKHLSQFDFVDLIGIYDVNQKVMAEIAETYANRLIITDDNPRSEDPAAIRKAVRGPRKRSASWRRPIGRKMRMSPAIFILAGKGPLVYGARGSISTAMANERGAFGQKERRTKQIPVRDNRRCGCPVGGEWLLRSVPKSLPEGIR